MWDDEDFRRHCVFITLIWHIRCHEAAAGCLKEANKAATAAAAAAAAWCFGRTEQSCRVVHTEHNSGEIYKGRQRRIRDELKQTHRAVCVSPTSTSFSLRLFFLPSFFSFFFEAFGAAVSALTALYWIQTFISASLIGAAAFWNLQRDISKVRVFILFRLRWPLNADQPHIFMIWYYCFKTPNLFLIVHSFFFPFGLNQTQNIDQLIYFPSMRRCLLHFDTVEFFWRYFFLEDKTKTKMHFLIKIEQVYCHDTIYTSNIQHQNGYFRVLSRCNRKRRPLANQHAGLSNVFGQEWDETQADTGRTLQFHTETSTDCLEQCFAHEKKGDYRIRGTFFFPPVIFWFQSLTYEYCNFVYMWYRWVTVI